MIWTYLGCIGGDVTMITFVDQDGKEQNLASEYTKAELDKIKQGERFEYIPPTNNDRAKLIPVKPKRYEP